MSVDDDHINHIFYINEDEINPGKEPAQKYFKTVFSGISTYILDENNQPVHEPSLVKYCEFMASGKRRLDYDEINGFAISTVFLGFNHGIRNDAPILFETVVYGKNGKASVKERYTSYDAAKDGHSRAVKRINQGR